MTRNKEATELMRSHNISNIFGTGKISKCSQSVVVRDSRKKQSAAQIVNKITPISWKRSTTRYRNHLKLEKHAHLVEQVRWGSSIGFCKINKATLNVHSPTYEYFKFWLLRTLEWTSLKMNLSYNDVRCGKLLLLEIWLNWHFSAALQILDSISNPHLTS